MKSTKPLLLIGLLPLAACQPEGEVIYNLDDAGVAACAEAEVALADGIQTGDELVLSFDCLNAGGQYDAMAPTLEAMNSATTPDGVVLLDLWIEVINQELTNASGGSTTIALAPVDMASIVGELLGFFESGAPQVGVDLAAEAIQSDVVDELLRMGGAIAYNAALLETGSGNPSLDEWLAALQDFMCKDYEEGSTCRSNLTLALNGMANNASESEYDPNDPANDDLRVALEYILYANGDQAEAKDAANEFAIALGLLGSNRYAGGIIDDSILVKTTRDLLPQLYGDDINTPEYEGYPSHNPSESALYGVLLALRDSDVQDAMEASGPDTFDLVNNYFPGSVSQRGNVDSSGYHTDNCLDFDEAIDVGGVANNGVDQMLRMVSASNVQYDATPTCEGLFNILLPIAEPYIELSGTKSISAIILEMAAVLPLPLLQIGSDLLNLPPTVALSNILCGMNLQYDDTEVLQAAVYKDDLINMSLPLLKAMNHAGQMENLANYLDDMWRVKGNPMCHMGPMLRHALDPNIPSDGGSSDINAILPDPSAPPGSTYHDQVIEPMLTALMDFAPHAEVVMAPMGPGLVDGQEAIAAMMFNLGVMASNPTSALNDVNLLSAELSQLGGGGGGTSLDLGPAADALNHDDLAYVSLLTLGHPDVVEAMIVGNSETPVSLIDAAGARLSDGTMSTVLAIFEAALKDLDQQLDEDG